jgi:hypothetical protein
MNVAHDARRTRCRKNLKKRIERAAWARYESDLMSRARGIMKSARIVLSVAVLSAAAGTFADPRLSLVKAGTVAQFSDAIVIGTASYSLDLLVDTDGHDVSGLQYYFITAPADTLTFDATPLIALDDPFSSADLFFSPSAGGTVNQAQGTTVWFKSSAGDYGPLVDNAVARYAFNTAPLSYGTYVFHPIGEELSNGSEVLASFAAPGTFALSVVPEPGSCGLVAMGALLLSSRRRGLRRDI